MPRRWRRLLVLSTLLGALGFLAYASLQSGPHGPIAEGDPVALLRGLAGCLGLGEEPPLVLRIRAWRVLTALGVGASLALAGAYLQGLFRNALASPSVLGVTAGASLGAALAIAVLGGFGLALQGDVRLTPTLVSGSAFLAALLVTWAVVSLATRGGRLSVPTLLLAGIAINSVVGGMMAALQSITMGDFEVARSILNWTFGNVDDRTGWQVLVVWVALALAVLPIPWVARELDLFAGGEEDAAALGVDVRRVKLAVLGAATLATGCAVSVAGQIPFVGLVVPHVVRALVGAGHRAVLPLSALAGAGFFLGCDLLQRTWLAETGLRPGAMMSLLGGPFFLFLLFRARRERLAW